MSSDPLLRSPVVRGFAALGAVLVLLLVGASLFGPEGVTRHEGLRQELDRLNAMNGELRQENGRLTAEVDGLKHNPELIEAVIRDELGWVRPDELVFIFPAEAEPPQEAP